MARGLPPHEITRRLDQQAHDVEDVYELLTEFRAETAAGSVQVDERLDQLTGEVAQVKLQLVGFGGRLDGVDGRLDRVEGHLDGHGQLPEWVLHLLEKPGT